MSRTREILEDALRRLNQKRNELVRPGGKLGSIENDIQYHYDCISELEEKAEKLREEQDVEGQLQALDDEERRIKQYLRDEYGELRSLAGSVDDDSSEGDMPV